MGKTKDYEYTFSLDLYLERDIPSFKSLMWDHEADWFIAPTLALDYLTKFTFRTPKTEEVEVA